MDLQSASLPHRNFGYRPPRTLAEGIRQTTLRIVVRWRILVVTRILIVDDSAFVRQRLHDLLQRHPGWVVCGEAVDGLDAVEKTRELIPDLIVLDFQMPGMDGLRAAREIAKLVPTVPILMFSMHMSRQLVEEARNAGCRGAVAKSDVGHVIEGLEALLRHESFFASSN
jgi:DNA-binding NarL/FixJ family response regulator